MSKCVSRSGMAMGMGMGMEMANWGWGWPIGDGDGQLGMGMANWGCITIMPRTDHRHLDSATHDWSCKIYAP